MYIVLIQAPTLLALGVCVLPHQLTIYYEISTPLWSCPDLLMIAGLDGHLSIAILPFDMHVRIMTAQVSTSCNN